MTNKPLCVTSGRVSVLHTHSVSRSHLGVLMPFESELYPPEWHATRRAKLKAANYCCEECGVKDRTIQHNTRDGQPYLVYLSIAHKQQYQTWMRDAETMVLCQRCHRRYDRQFVRKGGTRTYTPIGYIKVFVALERGREVLAGMAKTYDELRAMVAAFPDRTDFTCLSVINLAVVGNGSYTKQDETTITLHSEHGACVGLHPQLFPMKRLR